MRVNDLTAAERISIARRSDRPRTIDYINSIFESFIELSGDRCHGDDESIIGGIGFLNGEPVTVIGHQKGKTLEENVKYRFGMPNPEGYRKAARLMKQAEKFNRPIVTFVDTPGAYPGIEAEAGGQGEAIARSIALMTSLQVPIVSVFIGEGGSGGALAIGVADKTIMLENSIFSILSPEGFASILWKDSSRWQEAAEVMKLTAKDLYELGICDVIVPEGDGAHLAGNLLFDTVEREIASALSELTKKKGTELVDDRYRKLRGIGKDNGRS